MRLQSLFFWGIQSILGYTPNYYPIGNGEYSKNVSFFPPVEMIINLRISGGFPRNSQRPISSHGRPPWSSQLELSQAQPLTGPRSWRVFTSYPLHEAVKQNNPHMVAPLRRLQYQLASTDSSYKLFSQSKKAFIQRQRRQNFKLMKVCRCLWPWNQRECSKFNTRCGVWVLGNHVFFLCCFFQGVICTSYGVAFTPLPHWGMRKN